MTGIFIFDDVIVKISNDGKTGGKCSLTGHTCLIFFSRAEEVAHFFISPVKSDITALHPG